MISVGIGVPWFARIPLLFEGKFGDFFLRNPPFRAYAKLSMRVIFFTPWSCEGKYAYLGVRNVNFAGDFAGMQHGWYLSQLNYGTSLEFICIIYQFDSA